MTIYRPVWIIIGTDGQPHVERENRRGKTLRKPFLHGFGSQTEALTHVNLRGLSVSGTRRIEWDEFEKLNRESAGTGPLVKLGQGRERL